MKQSKALLLTTVIATMVTITGCQSTMNQAENQTAQHEVTQKEMATVQQILPQTLSRYNWRLVNSVNAQNQPLTALSSIKDQVEISFGRHNGQNLTLFSVGCNNIGAQYSLTNNVLNISNTRQTMMGCGELSSAESLLNTLMQGSSQLVIKGDPKAPILTQTTDNHSTLIWQGTLTPQAQFNQQGETVYWEVDHQTVACPDGSTKACLKVRQVNYNDQGIKNSVGEWKLYGGSIQGYTHDDNTDEVLRLKRFVVDPSDVKGKQFAYVLDAVVESSIVQ